MLNDEQFGCELRELLDGAVAGLAPSPGFLRGLGKRHHRQRVRRRVASGAVSAMVVATSVTFGLRMEGHNVGPTPSRSARSAIAPAPKNPGKDPSAPAQLVSFQTAADGAVTAIITDPLAAKGQLDAVFRQHGLDISVSVVPVSPSLVGTIVYSDLEGVSPVSSGMCLTGSGGGCEVGLKFPAGFTDSGNVTVGRAARPGEPYESGASPFGPGEALHCSGLLDSRVSAALPALKARALKVTWVENVPVKALPGSKMSGPTGLPEPVMTFTEAKPPSGYFVVNAASMSSTTLKAWIAPRPLTGESRFIQQSNQGC